LDRLLAVMAEIMTEDGEPVKRGPAADAATKKSDSGDGTG
jgi:hypothetical protein